MSDNVSVVDPGLEQAFAAFMRAFYRAEFNCSSAEEKVAAYRAWQPLFSTGTRHRVDRHIEFWSGSGPVSPPDPSADPKDPDYDIHGTSFREDGSGVVVVSLGSGAHRFRVSMVAESGGWKWDGGLDLPAPF
ncbi:hypothetical protein [Salininema proteolyticum]|uniref:DUF3828 domain-containing protein n=1 Tax=Salininema proteolyticum TaxID=1607685 RepID=A0ABV8U486_9ACTN